MLNASKGPAVRGPRAQMDRKLYKQHMQQLLAAVPGLEIVDGAVTNVLLESNSQDNKTAKASIAGVSLASGTSSTSSADHIRCCELSTASVMACNASSLCDETLCRD